MRYVVAITGASGAPYARRMLSLLGRLDAEVHCVASKAARITWKHELKGTFDDFVGDLPHVRVYDENDWFSPLASGSFQHDGMAVVPCSTRSLSALATGQSANLITRAGEVCLKERRPLVLLVREAPFNLIHLQNMTTLTQAGGIVVPASPAFYHHPRTVDDMIDFVLARVLDLMGIDHGLGPRWGEEQTLGADTTRQAPTPGNSRDRTV